MCHSSVNVVVLFKIILFSDIAFQKEKYIIYSSIICTYALRTFQLNFIKHI